MFFAHLFVDRRVPKHNRHAIKARKFVVALADRKKQKGHPPQVLQNSAETWALGYKELTVPMTMNMLQAAGYNGYSKPRIII